MNNRKLYESIMKNVAIQVKNAINEAFDDEITEFDEEHAEDALRALEQACNIGDEVTEDYIDECSYELIEEMGLDPDELSDEEYDQYVELLKKVYRDNMEDLVPQEIDDEDDWDDED